jgi:hypothetical protein
MLILHVTQASWTLCKTRVFPNISIICLHPLVLFEILLQTETKDFNVRPIPRRKRATNPTEVACSNVVAQLIAQATVLKLEGEKCLRAFPLVCCLAVSCIDLK